ncbi:MULTISPECIES: hypothetical protein [Actinomyces]|uniref:Uncharacterized protein n=1 Tax=Actinomyces respiraculi TaxID=2744574 RepID=A0A7T0PX16_9ACTO|nr:MULTISPECIES: hypothetical protein [Actinomyces]QPL05155.1 hypothetical protein ID810_10550 [Actinomyces respiraculi]
MSVLPRRLFGLGSLGIVAVGLAACGSSETDMSSGSETSSEQGVSTGGEGGGSGHVIVFEVTSTTATKADISMTTIDVNGAPLDQTFSNHGLPFSETVNLAPSQEIDIAMLKLGAQIKDGSDVTVSLTTDGGNAVTSSAEGENASATVFGESA